MAAKVKSPAWYRNEKKREQTANEDTGWGLSGAELMPDAEDNAPVATAVNSLVPTQMYADVAGKTVGTVIKETLFPLTLPIPVPGTLTENGSSQANVRVKVGSVESIILTGDVALNDSGPITTYEYKVDGLASNSFALGDVVSLGAVRAGTIAVAYTVNFDAGTTDPLDNYGNPHNSLRLETTSDTITFNVTGLWYDSTKVITAGEAVVDSTEVDNRTYIETGKANEQEAITVLSNITVTTGTDLLIFVSRAATNIVCIKAGFEVPVGALETSNFLAGDYFAGVVDTVNYKIFRVSGQATDYTLDSITIS